MTRDDIIKLAREAGLKVGTNISGVTLVGSPSTPGIAHLDIDEMHRFAALVAEQEREACAKLCESLKPTMRAYDHRFWDACHESSAAIRARGESN